LSAREKREGKWAKKELMQNAKKRGGDVEREGGRSKKGGITSLRKKEEFKRVRGKKRGFPGAYRPRKEDPPLRKN